MSDMTKLERRCVKRVLALGACTPIEGVRAVEAERRIAEALAVFDISAIACPARKRNLGKAECPRCHATPRDGCGLEISAAYAFISSVRATLAKMENDNE